MNLPIIEKNKWIVISNIIWVIVVFVLVAFPSHKSSEYRQASKVLTLQRDSLKSVVSNRETEILVLFDTIRSKEMKLDTVNYINIVLKKKLQEYETAYTRINNMSTDSNIRLLSEYLSEKDSPK